MNGKNQRGQTHLRNFKKLLQLVLLNGHSLFTGRFETLPQIWGMINKPKKNGGFKDE